MKIIERYNYKQEKPRVVAADLNEEDAKLIVRLLNKNNTKPTFYQVVSDNWK